MLPLSPLQRFGEFLPDRPDYESGGASIVKNAIPVGQDYAPVYDLSPLTDALAEPCRSGISVKASDGVVYTFAGTDSALYVRDGSEWTDLSKSGGYNGTPANRWRFVQYGDYVMCTNGVDNPQYFLIGTSTDFADVPNAPVCRYLSVINNFVVASGVVSDRTLVRWSALDGPLDWVASSATQSDSQNVQDVGEVTCVTAGSNSGVVVGTDAIGLMEYVGPPFIFTFRVVEPNRGSKILGSVVSYSNGVFYRGEDGFFFFNGAASQPIGYDKVDKWFLENSNEDNLSSMWSALDPRNKVVMYGVPSSDPDYCDKTLLYSWANQRWAFIEKNIQMVFNSLTESVNVDDLTDEDVDDVDIYVDDAYFAGGRLLLGAFGGDSRLSTFSGAQLEATIETGEFQLNPNGRAWIGSVMLFGDYTTATVSLKLRATQTASYTTTSAVGFQANGEAYFNNDARFAKAVVTLTTFERVSGIKVRFRATGAL